MGFRSTMITEDYYFEIPKEIVDKYPYFNFAQKVLDGKSVYSLPISSKVESKFYSSFERTDFFKDIQGLLKGSEIPSIDLVLLHECGGITKVNITKDKITGQEPTGWEEVKEVTHSYCYGCSDFHEQEKLNKNI